jgi:hypothetical protein
MRLWPQTWDPEAKAFGACAESAPADFVLYFGNRDVLSSKSVFDSLRKNCPEAVIVGCSTGTVVDGAHLSDTDATAVAVSLVRSRVKLASVALAGTSSFDTGREIATQLLAPDLVGVIVLSDGLNVNGSSLVDGMQSLIGSNIPIGGGLAGDGAAFENTLVAANAEPVENVVAALGFYGDKLEMRLGAAHGWDYFGPVRRVTRAEGNVLFEMDDEPALDLYARYLGDEAADLPASALLYPLLLINPLDSSDQVVRTILAVDHDARTMTFAGDIPEGWSARLMRGVFDNLTAGASEAAERAQGSEDADGKGLALLVSCVGRRLLMGQSAEDEVEATADVLADNYYQTGFYSYGEIATKGSEGHCGLHNQTMTVLTLSEVV